MPAETAVAIPILPRRLHVALAAGDPPRRLSDGSGPARRRPQAPEVFRSAELTAKSVVVYSTPMTGSDRNYAVLAGVVSSRWCPPRKAGGRPATHSQRRIVGWDRKVPARSSNRCVGLVGKSPLGHNLLAT